jgi:hypothetical protein
MDTQGTLEVLGLQQLRADALKAPNVRLKMLHLTAAILPCSGIQRHANGDRSG